MKITIIDSVKRVIEARKVRFLKKEQLRIMHERLQNNALKNFALTDEQISETQAFYKTHYGEKIDISSHIAYTCYSGKFTPCYFPESIYIPEFEHYLTNTKNYESVIQDKNITPMIFADSDVKTPFMLYRCIDGMIQDNTYHTITKEEFVKRLYDIGEIFYKPTIDTGAGKGCMLLNLVNGSDIPTGNTIESLIEGFSSNFVLQEKLVCHDSIRQIFPKSVNTFRIMTYRWKNEILSVPAIMRIGRGDMKVDNATLGGFFVGIEDNGKLLPTAIDKCGNHIISHPDTGYDFSKGYIDLFPKVRETALNLHNRIPQVGVANWDFTINEKGEVILIESNLQYGGIWVFQMAHGKPAFGDKTEEILHWLRRMKSFSPTERQKHRYGY